MIAEVLILSVKLFVFAYVKRYSCSIDENLRGCLSGGACVVQSPEDVVCSLWERQVQPFFFATPSKK